MKKLMAVASKKNVHKAQQKLNAVNISLSIPGESVTKFNGADALTLGHRLVAESRSDEALLVANALLSQIDDLVDIYLLKARALLNKEALGELQLLVEPLVKAAPQNQGVLMVAARYYYALGQARQSLAFTKRALKSNSQNLEALLHMELCYRYSGDIGNASKILQRCLSLAEPGKDKSDQQFKQYNTALFRLANYALLEDSQITYLERIVSKSDDRQLKVTAAYALATQNKMRKNQASETRYLKIANSQEAQLLAVESSATGNFATIYEKRFQAQQLFFTSDFQICLPDNRDQKRQQPVFVLGLPRSGTTLIEQILGSHSEIGQAGESKAFLGALKKASRQTNQIWSAGDYPASIKRMSPQQLGELVSDFYRHQSVLTEKSIYIDKELANFEYAGLMAALFPQAKFIHMDRAPMDIFLSCFRHSIPGVPETANLTALAEYYVYMKRLIGLWKSLFPDRLCIINYQSLVSDPEKYARELATFVGVNFEPAMMAFHKRKNIVRTLSVDQVRKKVYTTSVAGWRDYETVLQPAHLILQKYNIPLEGVGFLK